MYFSHTASLHFSGNVLAAARCASPVLDEARVVTSGCADQATWGTPCTISCALGYNATGNSTYCCTPAPGGAVYLGGSLVCTRISCPPAELPPGAVAVRGCEAGTYGQECIIACTDGYEASGSTFSRCQVALDGSFRYVGAESMQCLRLSPYPTASQFVLFVGLPEREEEYIALYLLPAFSLLELLSPCPPPLFSPGATRPSIIAGVVGGSVGSFAVVAGGIAGATYIVKARRRARRSKHSRAFFGTEGTREGSSFELGEMNARSL